MLLMNKRKNNSPSPNCLQLEKGIRSVHIVIVKKSKAFLEKGVAVHSLV